MHKLHSHLLKSFSWYNSWHNHPHHQHAHWVSFLVASLSIFSFLSGQINLPNQQSIYYAYAQSNNYSSNPFVINLPSQLVQDSPGVGLGNGAGGIFSHDLNGDGQMDFVITNLNVIAAYDHSGTQLWLINDNIWLSTYGAPGIRSSYPGYHNPGVIAGDIDGDGQQELAYLTFNSLLKIINARTGAPKKSYPSNNAVGLAIANFRGVGDRDAILLYNETNIKAINLETGATLWSKNNWRELDDTSTRVADINNDGRDEVLGPYILDHNGNKLNSWDLSRDLGTDLTGLDSLAIGDIVPGGPIELIIAEQGTNNEVIAVNQNQILWHTFRNNVPGTGECARFADPDKVTVGDFDTSRSGMETFVRSSCARHPWVLDSSGNIIATWNVSQTAPSGWYLGNDGSGRSLPDGVSSPEDEGGIDEVQAVNWFGDGRHILGLIQRQNPGPAALVNPLTGNFIQVFPGTAVRLYAANIAGDSRDELVTLNQSPATLKIYWNSQPSVLNQPDPWLNRLYRRLKQNFSHYSTSGISGGTGTVTPPPTISPGLTTTPTSSTPPSTGACINPAPNPSTVPDMRSVVQGVASAHPNWLQDVCNSYDFIDEVVRQLRAGTGGTRWAFEAKRANLSDPWQEGIAYYYGSGTAPTAGTMSQYEVFAVDIVHQYCGVAGGGTNTADWNVADWPYRSPNLVEVAYLYPRNAGSSLPAPQLCTGAPPPVPPPAPTGPPTITGISPTRAVVGQQVEIYGTNLVEDIKLESSDGNFYTAVGVADNQRTTISFNVPNVSAGIYKVSVTGPNGSATSPQDLEVISGGSGFPPPIAIGIPSEGLPTDLGQLIEAIFSWSLSLIGLVIFVRFFYAGFLWFTAAGNTTRTGQALEIMKHAVYGALILFSAWLILNTINPDLVKGGLTLPGLGTGQSTTTGTGTATCNNGVCSNGAVGPCRIAEDCQTTTSGGGGGSATCPAPTTSATLCVSVNQNTVLGILNKYPTTNAGITEAIVEVKGVYPNAYVIPHDTGTRVLDKIDFGGGMIVDVMVNAGATNASWGWIEECPCGG